MEIFLLLFDEIDDLVSMLRMQWHSLVSFIIALGLFLATGYLAMHMPPLALVVLGTGTVWLFGKATQAPHAIEPQTVIKTEP